MSSVNTATREHVAAEIRAAAARQRVTQRWVAKQIGMSQQALSRRWTGEHPFDLDELEAVAALLGLTWQDIFPPGAVPAMAPSVVTLSDKRPPAGRKSAAKRRDTVYSFRVSAKYAA